LIKPKKEQKTGTHYYSLLALENKKQQEKQRDRKGNNNNISREANQNRLTLLPSQEGREK
jgi:hypothetical protein